MFAYLKGILITVTFEKAVLDVNGVGYEVHIPLSTFSKLPQTGKTVLLYTSLVVREDAHKLFGFYTQDERDLFNKLDTVSGIGPKTALALIGHLEPDNFARAIAQGDINELCKVPSIGKKTAERLVIEMRDKLNRSSLDLSLTTSSPVDGSLIGDAISALVNLGYPQSAAQKAVKQVLEKHQAKLELSDLITKTLRSI